MGLKSLTLSRVRLGKGFGSQTPHPESSEAWQGVWISKASPRSPTFLPPNSRIRRLFIETLQSGTSMMASKVKTLAR